MGILERAEELWAGTTSTEDSFPWGGEPEAVEVADGVLFVSSFSNSIALATDDGLVVVDTGTAFSAEGMHAAVTAWSSTPVSDILYTHGHIDHVSGTHLYDEAARASGRPAPRVIAHRNVIARFERYVLTAGYNAAINQRQFGIPGLRWPVDYRYPDETFADTCSFERGGESFELHHANGETDDHLYVWIPRRRVLCCGDFVIWASPNAGNPQKVQRYPKEWADALRAMTALEAEVLLPGHGVPVVGKERVRAVLEDGAALLESLVDQTLELMNAGASLDHIVNAVSAPEELVAKPYLRPIYDEPEFVVRNVWRLYGGWFDGNPAHLKPPADDRLGTEVARLAGGARVLAQRASELAAAGELRLACSLIEFAWLAEPADRSVAERRATIYEQRAAAERSTMSTGVFSWAARESTAAAEPT